MELHSYFANLPEVQPASFSSRETIFNQGDRGRHFLIIREGLALVYREHYDFKKVAVRLARPNWILGTEIINGVDYFENNVQSIDSCEVLKVPKPTFVGVLENNPGMGFKILTQMATQLREVNQVISQHYFKIHSSRLASILLHLSDIGLLENMTEAEIGIWSGTSRESVSKHVAELTRQGGLIRSRRASPLQVANPMILQQYK